MPDKKDLVGRIGILADDTAFSQIKTFLTELPMESARFKPGNLDNILTLESSTIDAYNAVIITKSALEDPLLLSNLTTPVIYYEGERPSSIDANIEEKYNLFRVAQQETIFSDTRAAVEASHTIKEFLERNSKGIRILEHQGHPRFRNALMIIEGDKKSRERLQQRVSQMPLKDALWSAIVDDMLKYDRSELTTDATRETLAHNIVDFMKRYQQFELEESLKVMGEGESGEDSVISTDPAKSTGYSRVRDAGMRFTVLRVMEPRTFFGKQYSAKDIAEQRYRDVKWFHDSPEHKDYFRTPRALKPFNFEDLHPDAKKKLKEEYPDFNENKSILIFEEVPGHRLYKSLLTLRNALLESDGKEEEAARRKKIYAVGKGLVKKYLDDCAYLLKKGNPDTIIKPKPSASEVIGFYESQISEVPEAFRKRTTIPVSESEEKLYLDGVSLLELMTPRIKPHHIVRNRDSWVGNVVLRNIPVNFSIDQYIKFFLDGNEINEKSMNSTFENIDKQYRWGHVLEDWAQIMAAYETNFMLRIDTDHSNYNPKHILDLRNDFLTKIGGRELCDELTNEPLITFPLVMYRAIRKMYLFTNYWESTCRALADVETKKQAPPVPSSGLDTEVDKMPTKYRARRERFSENIRHYALLSKVTCKKISVFLTHDWQSEENQKTINDSEKEYIHDLKEMYLSEISLNEASAKQSLQLLESNSTSASGKEVIRAFGLAAFLQKIYSGFSSRTAFRNMYQKESQND